MSKSGRGNASIKKGRVFVLANFKLPLFKLYHHLRSNSFRNPDSSSGGLIRDPTFRAPLPACIMYSTSLTINIKCFDRSPVKNINDSRTSSDCMAECELVGWGVDRILSSILCRIISSFLQEFLIFFSSTSNTLSSTSPSSDN